MMNNEASYLTPEGAARLREELEYLKGPGRDELSKRLRAAIQQGDLSENADYAKAKEDQGFLEGRIQELESVLRNVVIIEEENVKRGEVNVGTHVTIQEDDFPTETYFLVGPKEADPRQGRISYESPIGRAMVGHHVGEIIEADTPNGVIKFKIVKIE
jgi:transcription elongation factor GreA